MGKLNAEQVKQLADDFMLMANALGDYRYKNFKMLTKEENLKLKELCSKTLSLTTSIYTQSALLVIDEVENSLAQINTITVETQKLYSKLTSIQKVIDRATSVLILVSTIISLDSNGTAEAIKKLLNTDA